MTTRKTFLGRAGSAVGLLALGPEKLYGALRRPMITEMLADGEWHRFTYWWFGPRGGLAGSAIDGVQLSGKNDKQWPEPYGLGGFEWRDASFRGPSPVDLAAPGKSLGPECGPHGFDVRRWPVAGFHVERAVTEVSGNRVIGSVTTESFRAT